jgi:hypothetical protein
MKTRSTTEDNGRDEHGRFTPGNSLAKGNPHAVRVAKLRSALLNTVTEDDMREIIRKMVTLAKDGDVMACRVLLERILGKPEALDLLARLEALEAELGVTT